MRRLITYCLSFCCVPILALAQDSSRADASPPSLTHTARVYFDAYYAALRPLPRTVENMTFGDATFAPFTGDHVQVGILPTWQLIQRTDAAYDLTGSASLIANYVFGDGTRSRPYAGVFLERGDRSETFGLQAGWLRFLTPSVALRTEARYRHASYAGRDDSYDLLIRFDPYLFGRANQSVRNLPGFGAVDLNFVADFAVHATPPTAHTLSMSGLLAPFIARWLQAGTDGWLFYYNGVPQHQIELFGRAYLPIDTRLVPFAEAFISNESNVQNSHGARAGMRVYLTRGVAFDAAFEWRNYQPFRDNDFTFAVPETRLLHAGLTTQLGLP